MLIPTQEILYGDYGIQMSVKTLKINNLMFFIAMVDFVLKWDMMTLSIQETIISAFLKLHAVLAGLVFALQFLYLISISLQNNLQ